MSVNVKAPNGETIDVEAVAEATPEEAFLLLSDDVQHEIETSLSASAQQEIGELILVLADVVAKSAESYPLVRIDVRQAPVDGDELRATVSVERSGQTVFKRTCPDIIEASVDGLQGLWESVTAEQPTSLGRATMTLSFLKAISRLTTAAGLMASSFLETDKPKE